jgi:hypothetical protein
MRFNIPLRFHATCVTQEVWDCIRSLPIDFSLHTWDALLLDAVSLLPDVAPAIVVANAALETFIPWALNQLHDGKKFPPKLWSWIHNRGDWYKEPSVEDQFDTLLEVLSGRSLKEDKDLWEAFKNLSSSFADFATERERPGA